ncbi:hypothetical protein C8R47DRAFT_1075456 [Mycena vitilis]|nr:hypothetical protein C8R47DRAFT_1075456 [Mycena vitilis]
MARGPKRKFEPDQFAWLQEQYIDFTTAQCRNKLPKFWAKMEKEFFLKWREEDVLGLVVQDVDDGSAEGVPQMSPEDMVELGKAQHKRKAQLHSWFNNWGQKQKKNEGAVSTTVGSLAAQLFKNLTKRRRRLQEIEIFQKRNKRVVSDAVEAAKIKAARLAKRAAGDESGSGSSSDTTTSSSSSDTTTSSDSSSSSDTSSDSDSSAGGAGRFKKPLPKTKLDAKGRRNALKLRRKVVAKLWANASAEEKEIVRRIYREQQPYVADEDLLEKAAEERTPEELQAAIDEIVAIVTEFHAGIYRMTGWLGVTILGGPTPEEGGSVTQKTFCSGESPGGLTLQASLADWDNVMSGVGQWLKRCFPRELRKKRALNPKAPGSADPVPSIPDSTSDGAKTTAPKTRVAKNGLPKKRTKKEISAAAKIAREEKAKAVREKVRAAEAVDALTLVLGPQVGLENENLDVDEGGLENLDLSDGVEPTDNGAGMPPNWFDLDDGLGFPLDPQLLSDPATSYATRIPPPTSGATGPSPNGTDRLVQTSTQESNISPLVREFGAVYGGAVIQSPSQTSLTPFVYPAPTPIVASPSSVPGHTSQSPFPPHFPSRFTPSSRASPKTCTTPSPKTPVLALRCILLLRLGSRVSYTEPPPSTSGAAGNATAAHFAPSPQSSPSFSQSTSGAAGDATAAHFAPSPQSSPSFSQSTSGAAGDATAAPYAPSPGSSPSSSQSTSGAAGDATAAHFAPSPQSSPSSSQSTSGAAGDATAAPYAPSPGSSPSSSQSTSGAVDTAAPYAPSPGLLPSSSQSTGGAADPTLAPRAPSRTPSFSGFGATPTPSFSGFGATPTHLPSLAFGSAYSLSGNDHARINGAGPLFGGGSLTGFRSNTFVPATPSPLRALLKSTTATAPPASGSQTDETPSSGTTPPRHRHHAGSASLSQPPRLPFSPSLPAAASGLSAAIEDEGEDDEEEEFGPNSFPESRPMCKPPALPKPAASGGGRGVGKSRGGAGRGRGRGRGGVAGGTGSGGVPAAAAPAFAFLQTYDGNGGTIPLPLGTPVPGPSKTEIRDLREREKARDKAVKVKEAAEALRKKTVHNPAGGADLVILLPEKRTRKPAAERGMPIPVSLRRPLPGEADARAKEADDELVRRLKGGKADTRKRKALDENTKPQTGKSGGPMRSVPPALIFCLTFLSAYELWIFFYHQKEWKASVARLWKKKERYGYAPAPTPEECKKRVVDEQGEKKHLWCEAERCRRATAEVKRAGTRWAGTRWAGGRWAGGRWVCGRRGGVEVGGRRVRRAGRQRRVIRDAGREEGRTGGRAAGGGRGEEAAGEQVRVVMTRAVGARRAVITASGQSGGSGAPRAPAPSNGNSAGYSGREQEARRAAARRAAARRAAARRAAARRAAARRREAARAGSGGGKRRVGKRGARRAASGRNDYGRKGSTVVRGGGGGEAERGTVLEGARVRVKMRGDVVVTHVNTINTINLTETPRPSQNDDTPTIKAPQQSPAGRLPTIRPRQQRNEMRARTKSRFLSGGLRRTAPPPRPVNGAHDAAA